MGGGGGSASTIFFSNNPIIIAGGGGGGGNGPPDLVGGGFYSGGNGCYISTSDGSTGECTPAFGNSYGGLGGSGGVYNVGNTTGSNGTVMDFSPGFAVSGGGGGGSSSGLGGNADNSSADTSGGGGGGGGSYVAPTGSNITYITDTTGNPTISITYLQTSYVIDTSNTNASAYTYTWNNSLQSWSIIPTANITYTTHNSSFGSALSLASDATKLVVGDKSYDNSNGAVYTYNWTPTSNSWSIINTSNLTPNFDSSSFGSSIAVNSGATRLVVGAPNSNNSGYQGGAIFTYEWNDTSNSWSNINSANILFNTNDNTSSFGLSVDLNVDGSKLCVGASSLNSNNNTIMYTYEYNSSSNIWVNLNTQNIKNDFTVTSNTITNTTTTLNFASSIALSSNFSKLMLINNINVDVQGSGYGYIYTFNNKNISLNNYNTIKYNYETSKWLLGGYGGGSDGNLIYSSDTINWTNCNLDNIISYTNLNSVALNVSGSISSLALSSDGNRLVLGYTTTYNCSFLTYEWNNLSKTWVELSSATLVYTASVSNGVSLNRDGSILVISLTYDSFAYTYGTIYTYQWNSISWSIINSATFNVTITASVLTGGLELSNDALMLIVGDSFYMGDVGIIYTYYWDSINKSWIIIFMYFFIIII